MQKEIQRLKGLISQADPLTPNYEVLMYRLERMIEIDMRLKDPFRGYPDPRSLANPCHCEASCTEEVASESVIPVPGDADESTESVVKEKPKTNSRSKVKTKEAEAPVEDPASLSPEVQKAEQ